MNRLKTLTVAALTCALPACTSAPRDATPPASSPLPTGEIDSVLLATGAWNDKEQVDKVSFPTSDVAVEVDGFKLPPFLGLTSWVAFKPTSGRPAPPKSSLDAAALAAVLGVPGQSRDGMFKAVFGRSARHGSWRSTIT